MKSVVGIDCAAAIEQVFVDPRRRPMGMATALVGELSDPLISNGKTVMYRVESTNEASIRLSGALGYSLKSTACCRK